MLKTVLHAYRFDTRIPEEYQAWQELKAKLANHPRRMKSINQKGSYCRRDLAGPIELDTKHLFDNQWNTVCGHRVFDWAQDYTERYTLKQGHWLEQTDEMKNLRASTFKCGYCGHQTTEVKVFCDKCLGSDYLDEENLPLLRMKALSDSSARPQLSDKEFAGLLPLYIEAQTKAKQDQLTKRRLEVLESTDKAMESTDKAMERIRTERDGMLWLIDRGINVGNVIFYNHTGTFSFGWRRPIKGAALEAWKELLKDFPYPTEIKS